MSETSMVERVARAIAVADLTPDRQYTDLARAAIEALREPNEEMLATVCRVPEHLIAEHGEQVRPQFEAATIADRMVIRQHWRDLIDAALSSNKETDR